MDHLLVGPYLNVPKTAGPRVRGSTRVAQHQALPVPQEAAFHWLHHSTSPGDGFRVSTWGGSRAAVWEEAVFAQHVALDLKNVRCPFQIMRGLLPMR